MSRIREDAIAAVASMPPGTEEAIPPVGEITGTFGSDVFSIETMQTLLSAQTFKKLTKSCLFIALKPQEEAKTNKQINGNACLQQRCKCC